MMLWCATITYLYEWFIIHDSWYTSKLTIIYGKLWTVNNFCRFCSRIAIIYLSMPWNLMTEASSSQVNQWLLQLVSVRCCNIIKYKKKMIICYACSDYLNYLQEHRAVCTVKSKRERERAWDEKHKSYNLCNSSVEKSYRNP